MTASTPIVYLHLLLQIALFALIAISALSLGRLWLPGARSLAERIVDATVIFLALLVSIALLLSESRLLHRYPALLACLAVTTLSVFLRRRYRVDRDRRDELPTEGARPALSVLALAAAAVYGLPFAIRALFVVPVDWDSLTYHLFFPATWIQRQQVDLLAWPYPYNLVAFFPANNELVNTMAMIVLENDLFAKPINLPLITVTAIATGLLCRSLGGTRQAGWVAALLVVTTPAMFSWAATSYAEPLLNTCILAAVLCGTRALAAQQERLPRFAFMAGLAGGLAMGTKYTAVLPAVCSAIAVATAPLLWPKTGQLVRLRMAARALVLFCLAALLTGGYWYLRNFVVTGNPVYPAPLLGLAAIDNPQLPWDVTIFSRLADLWRTGWLERIWIGAPGDHMVVGWKAFVLAPLALALLRRKTS